MTNADLRTNGLFHFSSELKLPSQDSTAGIKFNLFS